MQTFRGASEAAAAIAFAERPGGLQQQLAQCQLELFRVLLAANANRDLGTFLGRTLYRLGEKLQGFTVVQGPAGQQPAFAGRDGEVGAAVGHVDATLQEAPLDELQRGWVSGRQLPRVPLAAYELDEHRLLLVLHATETREVVVAHAPSSERPRGASEDRNDQRGPSPLRPSEQAAEFRHAAQLTGDQA